jgi:predicted Rossmann-fold nucleotide-binding protein
MKVTVFCGSSIGNSPEYVEMAEELGKLMAEQDITLVYGGGYWKGNQSFIFINHIIGIED